MDKLYEGGIVFHKATRQRCVVIKKNDNGTITVRTEKDEEKSYYPQELETQEEEQDRIRQINETLNRRLDSF